MIISLVDAQAKQLLNTFIHFTLTHIFCARVFFSCTFVSPVHSICATVFAMYVEWSVSNIRSLKSTIYIDRLAFNRWSSSPLPSSFPFVSCLYVFFNLNFFGGALLIDDYKCYQKANKKMNRKKICDAIRFRMDRFHSIWFYRTSCVRRSRSTKVIYIHTEKKKGDFLSGAILRARARTQTHSLNTSQRHSIALNHRSIYAFFCFNFYCINNRYLAVAHIYGKESTTDFVQLFVVERASEQVSEPTGEWVSGKVAVTIAGRSICHSVPNDTPK